MAGFDAWDYVGPMVNQATATRYRGGEVWLPALEDVQAALDLVTQAWEKLTP